MTSSNAQFQMKSVVMEPLFCPPQLAISILEELPNGLTVHVKSAPMPI